MKTFRRLVIDADQAVYASGFAAEGESYSAACFNLDKNMRQIIEDCGNPDEVVVYCKGEGNYREGVAISHGYKDNRDSRKPEAYEVLMDHLKNQWEAIPADGMEADDCVSIELWSDFVESGGSPSKCDVILSSPDKDLKNTPGWHYNPRTRETKFYTLAQSNRHFWFQMLTGDRVDNIKGLPWLPPDVILALKLPKAAAKGVGDATAKKVMERSDNIEDCYRDVIGLYKAWGEAEGFDVDTIYYYFMEQATLLWMLREVDEDGEPIHFEFDKSEFDEIPSLGLPAYE